MSGEIGALVFAGLFGLIFGSFLNVVIYRLPRGQSLSHPPSRCPNCGSSLKWYDNVPVLGWLMLGGRCRQCRTAISAQYPIVEFITGALFVLVAWNTADLALLASRLVLVCILVALFGIDLEHQILPNRITLSGIVVGLIFSTVAPPGVVDALLGALLGFGLLWVVGTAYLKLRGIEGLGGGDPKMLAMIGAFLGWKAVLVTLVFASVTGSAIGLLLIASRRLGKQVPLAFGTFLAVGALFAMFLTDPFLASYARLMDALWGPALS